MKLILLAGDDSYEISDVKLLDGVVPCLSGIPFSGNENSEEMLEPSIWFKILIMDVMSIDCKRQTVQWSLNKTCDSSGDFDGDESISNVVRLGEDCVDFINGLDEVFDAIPSLLSSFRSAKLTKEDFYKSLIQLLHVNVLPNVKLSFENLDPIKRIIDDYVNKLDSLDEVIISKTNMLAELKKTKQRERQKFAQILVDSKKLPHFDDFLVQILENDFKVDLKKIDIDLEVFKESISKHSLTESHSDPNEAIYLKCALEKLYKIKNKPRLSWLYGNPSKSDEHQVQKIYIKMVETEGKMRALITKLLDTKMMLRSVIETMKSVTEELNGGCDSYGIELNTKNFVNTSTIIGESLSAKSWVSLPKHLFNLFSDTNHPISREHMEGMRSVSAFTKAILDEHNLQHLYKFTLPQNKAFSSLQVLKQNFSLNVETNESKNKSYSNIPMSDRSLKPCLSEPTPFVNYVDPEMCLNVSPDSSQQIGDGPSDFVFVLNSSSDFVSRSIEKLRIIITDHFNSVCKQICEEVNKSYVNINQKKIWAIYENYFYEHTIDGLLKVFCLEYSDKIKCLIKSIHSLTLGDLDLLDSLMTKLLLGSIADNLTNSGQSDASSMSHLIGNSQDSLMHSSSDEDLYSNYEVNDFCKSVGSLNSTFNSSGISYLKVKDDELSSFNCIQSSVAEAMSTKLKQNVLHRYSKSFQNIVDALKAKTPKTKTHHLLRCLRNMTSQTEVIYKEIFKKHMKLCSDDIMDALIILLCNILDPIVLEDLYVQVQFLIQVLPQCFCNGEYHFVLVQFVAVFQYLNDKALMKRNRVYNM